MKVCLKIDLVPLFSQRYNCIHRVDSRVVPETQRDYGDVENEKHDIEKEEDAANGIETIEAVWNYNIVSVSSKNIRYKACRTME